MTNPTTQLKNILDEVVNEGNPIHQRALLQAACGYVKCLLVNELITHEAARVAAASLAAVVEARLIVATAKAKNP